METTRALTSRRRDIVTRMVDDDPTNAELLIELLLVTDSQTSTGAAARDDLLTLLYSKTTESQMSRDAYMRAKIDSVLGIETTH